MRVTQTFALACVIAIGMTLSGCQLESDSDDDDTNDNDSGTSINYIETTVDASSYNDWVYFDLDNNDEVTASDDWDIKIRRYNITPNEALTTAIIVDQSEFYDSNGDAIISMFLNADAVELLTTEVDQSTITFEAPSKELIMNAEGITFYDYDYTTHLLHANDDAVWVIRSNTGNAYAKLRPTLLYDDTAEAYEQASFELFIQGTSDAGFSNTPVTWTVAIPGGVGSGCYDIETATTVDCSSDDWDIHFNLNISARTLEMTLNGGASGDGSAAAVYTGAFDVADTALLTAGIQDSANDDFDLTSYHYAQDNLESSFSEYPWYAYNVNGAHGIWPNYRVYGVEADTGTYLVQFTNYYSDAAESGHISFRFLAL